jgi:hypothetical protein
VLILLVLFGLPLIVSIIILANRDPQNSEGGGIVFISVIAWIMFLLLATRFVFWGVWGKENIRVSNSSIQVNYDYKVYMSKTIIHKGEMSNLILKRDYSEDDSGRLSFEGENLIYSSVLKISNEDFEELLLEFPKLFSK